MNLLPHERPRGAAPPVSVDAGRRRFLLAAVGAGALGASGPAAPAPPATVPAPAVKRGYHETPHIRSYYRTAAYW